MNVVPLVGLGVTVRGSLRRLAPSGIDIPNTLGAMIGKSKKLTLRQGESLRLSAQQREEKEQQNKA